MNNNKEEAMFKIIGGVVVCAFALYGLVKYLERTAVKVESNPEVLRKPGKAASEAVVAEDATHSGEPASSEAPDAGASAATT